MLIIHSPFPIFLRYSGLVCHDMSLVMEADFLNPSRERHNFYLPLFQSADPTS